MRPLTCTLLLLSLSLLTGRAFAAVSDTQNFAYWLCKNKAEVRTIRVHVDGGACTTYYEKLGLEKNVGSGKNNESCLSFLNNIKTNLEKSSWSCRDISAAHVSAG